MEPKLAKILIAAFDGARLSFFDVTDVTQGTLDRIVPHLTEKESKYLQASKDRGYSVSQQFAHAVTCDGTFRANQLLNQL